MIRAGDRLRHELCEGAACGVTAIELAELVSRIVAPVVAHDGLRLVGTNPAAGFGPGSFSFWHGYDRDLGLAVLRQYYSGTDPCLPEHLALRAVPAGVVDVGGGVELRWLLRDARGSWGGFTLLRAGGGRRFDRDEVNRVAQLEPMLIAALRGFVTAGPLTPAVPRIPAGVFIIGADGKIRARTSHGQRWRDLTRQLVTPDWLAEASLFGLATLTRDPLGRPARVCTPVVVKGLWLVAEAQALDAGDVAIVFQTATGEQLLPTFCDWYGITARERAVVAELCDAAAPKQIARRLGLSVYTVNDHLKAVFRKTGAGCRAELMTALNG